MGYAINKEGTGWYSVDGPDDVRTGDTYSDTVPVLTPSTTKTIFTSLDYLSKFTDAEYASVRSGPMTLQRGLDSLIAAQFVDLDDPRTAEYLSGMVSTGIIDEARKTELLTPETAAS